MLGQLLGTLEVCINRLLQLLITQNLDKCYFVGRVFPYILVQRVDSLLLWSFTRLLQIQ